MTHSVYRMAGLAGQSVLTVNNPLSEIRWWNVVTNDMKIKAYVGYFSGAQPLES